MNPNESPPSGEPDGRPRGAINLVSFLIPFLFVWLVFDNMALGLLAGLVFGGGSAAVQRAADKKDAD